MRFFLMTFLLLFITACDSEITSKTVNISFTADTQGRLEPCGCFTGQYGGMARMATRFKSLPTNGLQLRFDAGDAVPGKEDYNLVLYRYVRQAFQQMKFDVLNVGSREARLSRDQLLAVCSTDGPPLISANLLNASTGKPLLPASYMIERDGVKIAVCGVVDPMLLDEDLGEGLQVEDMTVALAEALKEMKDADMRVLLAFCNKEKMRELARQFYEFDVILGGKVTQPSQKLIRENRSVILYTTNKAKNFGFMQAQLTTAKGLSKVEYDIPFLYEQIPEDLSIRELNTLYRSDIATKKLKIDGQLIDQENTVPGVEAQAVYVGTQACASCHSETHKSWSETAHAHAFKTLDARAASADPRCIDCHTVGFGEESGYKRVFKDKKLVNVGCESCHGPGSEHIRQRSSGEKAYFKYRPLGEGDCRSCHQGEFSRPFDWQKMWPKVQHGKEK